MVGLLDSNGLFKELGFYGLTNVEGLLCSNGMLGLLDSKGLVGLLGSNKNILGSSVQVN